MSEVKGIRAVRARLVADKDGMPAIEYNHDDLVRASWSLVMEKFFPKPKPPTLWQRMAILRRIRLGWDRFNVILGWPLLFIVDIGIVWTGVQTWKQARAYSNNALLKVWNRNKAVRIPCQKGDSA